MISIAVSGARGRMGQRIIALAGAEKDLHVSLGFEASNHPDLGKTIDMVPITDDLSRVKECDCLIDFSYLKATGDYVQAAKEAKKSLVIGTTGLGAKECVLIEAAAKTIPIVYSPNMSVGVNLIFGLIDQAAKALSGYQVSMSEAHHIHKKDSPSGTAKKMADIVKAKGFALDYENIEAIRQGEIVGDHSLVFESDVDRIEISHSAKTRDIFALGALVACRWVVGKPKGLYSMQDVLLSLGSVSPTKKGAAG